MLFKLCGVVHVSNCFTHVDRRRFAMKTKVIRIISIVMLVILILALVTLTAGAVAKANLAKQYPAPGQLVDVGGYKMHIHCTGQGSPTVILEAGMGNYSLFL